ncbi:hypothetical protein NHX12_007964 [Muraenolepis orangiensis]|uniref:Uncharacterized protein n=1 Tax=Muraenolepis orangiensis TaxID=630683 RepID=A0A9Q0I7N3_9TELE|nr:hypothetical protein NHX12_007964 [Muraenolepis orangiensis]
MTNTSLKQDPVAKIEEKTIAFSQDPDSDGITKCGGTSQQKNRSNRVSKLAATRLNHPHDIGCYRNEKITGHTEGPLRRFGGKITSLQYPHYRSEGRTGAWEAPIWKKAAPPSHKRWVEEVMSHLKLKQLKHTTRGSIAKHYKLPLSGLYTPLFLAYPSPSSLFLTYPLSSSPTPLFLTYPLSSSPTPLFLAYPSPSPLFLTYPLSSSPTPLFFTYPLSSSPTPLFLSYPSRPLLPLSSSPTPSLPHLPLSSSSTLSSSPTPLFLIYPLSSSPSPLFLTYPSLPHLPLSSSSTPSLPLLPLSSSPTPLFLIYPLSSSPTPLFITYPHLQ